MREALRERERKILQDLSAFKVVNDSLLKPKRFNNNNNNNDDDDGPKLLQQQEEEEEDAEENNQQHLQQLSYNESPVPQLINLPIEAYSFAIDSPVIADFSRVLEGSFAMINDFSSSSSSSPSNTNEVPGSSKIASPTRVFRTSERTSPIKSESELEPLNLSTRRTRIAKRISKQKDRRIVAPTKSRSKRSKQTKSRKKEKLLKPRTMNSPPNSPFQNGIAIDSEFLENYPGIWCKRLPVPLIVSPSDSPDHFILKNK
jgi:hypothetical protein